MIVPVEETDLSELSSNGPLLQSSVWAGFKGEFGWDAHAIRPSAGLWAGDTILVLTRKLAPAVRLAYVPYAPPAPPGSHEAGEELAGLGAGIAAALPERPVCVRFDLQWEPRLIRSAAGLRKAPLDVQPPSTVIIDLQPDLESILAAMHKKNRYNVGLSNRKGVVVRSAPAAELDRWYDLYRETALRDHITVHPLRYYAALFEHAANSDDFTLDLYLAEHDDDLLAGIIVAGYGDQATYLYGASSNLKREVMPNYALQWHAITRAREAGHSSYDLFGVPPADDPAHPMHGLFRFKTGFGGRLVHRAGSWDVVTRAGAYTIYSVAERLRSFYFHRVRKARAR